MVDRGYKEGRRFSGSRLRLSREVESFQRGWKGLRLYRGAIFESGVLTRRQHFLFQVEVAEALLPLFGRWRKYLGQRRYLSGRRVDAIAGRLRRTFAVAVPGTATIPSPSLVAPSAISAVTVGTRLGVPMSFRRRRAAGARFPSFVFLPGFPPPLLFRIGLALGGVFAPRFTFIGKRA